jgi:hypothetical protein
MASKKRSSKKVSKKKSVAKKVVKAAGDSKMDRATAAYKELTGRGLPRKAVIEAFMSKDIGLTKAGASTYFQLIRSRVNDQ